MTRTEMPTSDAAPDADIARAILHRDRQAADAVYRRFAPGLRVFVTRIVVDRALAEDVVHDVMVELWEHPQRFQPDRGTLRSWLLTLAHRRAVDRIRSIEAARKRDRTVGIRDHYSVSVGPDLWDPLFDRPALRDALAQLTAKQRDAVALRYLHEKTPTELAQILGINTGTAKTRVRDGLLALRAVLHTDTELA